MRPSAGTRSPAASSTTSPGTRRGAGISASGRRARRAPAPPPSARKASTARPARCSCTMSSATLISDDHRNEAEADRIAGESGDRRRDEQHEDERIAEAQGDRAGQPGRPGASSRFRPFRRSRAAAWRRVRPSARACRLPGARPRGPPPGIDGEGAGAQARSAWTASDAFAPRNRQSSRYAGARAHVLTPINGDARRRPRAGVDAAVKARRGWRASNTWTRQLQCQETGLYKRILVPVDGSADLESRPRRSHRWRSSPARLPSRPRRSTCSFSSAPGSRHRGLFGLQIVEAGRGSWGRGRTGRSPRRPRSTTYLSEPLRGAGLRRRQRPGASESGTPTSSSSAPMDGAGSSRLLIGSDAEQVPHRAGAGAAGPDAAGRGRGACRYCERRRDVRSS